jgi:hypothetical protein
MASLASAREMYVYIYIYIICFGNMYAQRNINKRHGNFVRCGVTDGINKKNMEQQYEASPTTKMTYHPPAYFDHGIHVPW